MRPCSYRIRSQSGSGMSRRAQLGVGFRVKFTVEGLHVNVQVEAALEGAVAATSVVVEPAVPQ